MARLPYLVDAPASTEATKRGSGPSGPAGALPGDEIWIGEHSVDGDILVLDPAVADPSADRLSFYSMTQLRNRVFPRSVVTQKIRQITDDVRSALTRKAYAERAELRASRDVEVAESRAAQFRRQRGQVIEQHQRYLATLRIPYQGVQDTPLNYRPGRRVRCHACGIALDDFAGTICSVCTGVLCSCGACACGYASRGR